MFKKEQHEKTGDLYCPIDNRVKDSTVQLILFMLAIMLAGSWLYGLTLVDSLKAEARALHAETRRAQDQILREIKCPQRSRDEGNDTG